MAVSLLDPARVEFPSPEAARQDGLLAVGGDLSPNRLLGAYRNGIFPWTDDPVTWWSPHPRAIFEIPSFVTPARAAAKLARRRLEEGGLRCLREERTGVGYHLALLRRG